MRGAFAGSRIRSLSRPGSRDQSSIKARVLRCIPIYYCESLRADSSLVGNFIFSLSLFVDFCERQLFFYFYVCESFVKCKIIHTDLLICRILFSSLACILRINYSEKQD